jgi:hypothetical protein
VRIEDELTRALAAYDRYLRTELRRLGRQMDIVEREEGRIKTLLRLARRGQRVAPPRGPALSLVQAGALANPILKVQALGGLRVGLVFREAGALQVTRKELMLTRASFDLLKYLASRPLDSSGFPQTVTLASLADTLSKHDGRTVKPGATSERLTRLRREFENAGLNPYWLDRDNAKAIRLLIRRPTPQVSASHQG